ncbi:hypothetical protein PZ895_14440 [Mesorhizobium sp. YIM 152430]|uniref:hypothetical protein n=1 Tax=Mesorhizobium sp. YIM 152430 TaxID=3031761 RepID=UPI0023DC5022|nr:hypothetical protein [Mesorhizobium sp. YIM 152430]MDF1600958.1 hypothetical protein [Mesorhizobium sp. YIM 152430]
MKFYDGMTFKEMRQALWETISEFEDEYAIHHARGVSLYFTPTDEFGEVVVPRTPLGKAIDKITKRGPYKSAADDFVP